MKKLVLSTIFAFSLVLPAVAEIAFNGFVRAGITSTIDDNHKASAKTWYAGRYFSGDSTGSRARFNIGMRQQLENGSTGGAFVRVQFDNFDNELGWQNLKYADAYIGFLNDKITLAGGKIYDRWICSDGFEGYSFVDEATGASIAFTPVEGLTFAGAAIKDYLDEDDEFDLDALVFGAKYAKDNISAVLQVAGMGQLLGAFTYTPDNFLLSAEALIALSEDGYEELESVAYGIVQVEYTGVEDWTFGVLAEGTLDTKGGLVNKKDGKDIEDDFTLTITPAVKWQYNKSLAFSFEAAYNQIIADDAIFVTTSGTKDTDTYVTFTPGVWFYASPKAYINVWAQFSTYTDRSPSQLAGVSATYKF